MSGADSPKPSGNSKAGVARVGNPAVSSCNTAKLAGNAANCSVPNEGSPAGNDIPPIPPIAGGAPSTDKDMSPNGASSGGVRLKSSDASKDASVARLPIANDHSGGVRSSVGISNCASESHNPPNASQPPGNRKSIPSALTAISSRAAIAISKANVGNSGNPAGRSPASAAKSLPNCSIAPSIIKLTPSPPSNAPKAKPASPTPGS